MGLIMFFNPKKKKTSNFSFNSEKWSLNIFPYIKTLFFKKKNVQAWKVGLHGSFQNDGKMRRWNAGWIQRNSRGDPIRLHNLWRQFHFSIKNFILGIKLGQQVSKPGDICALSTSMGTGCLLGPLPLGVFLVISKHCFYFNFLISPFFFAFIFLGIRIWNIFSAANQQFFIFFILKRAIPLMREGETWAWLWTSEIVIRSERFPQLHSLTPFLQATSRI